MCLYRGMESQQRPEESVRNGYGRRIICNPVCPKVCGVGDPQTVVSERDQPEKTFQRNFLMTDRSARCHILCNSTPVPVCKNRAGSETSG